MASDTVADNIIQAQHHLLNIGRLLIQHGPLPGVENAPLPSNHPAFAIFIAKLVFDGFHVPYQLKVGFFHHRGCWTYGPQKGSLIMPPEQIITHAWLATPTVLENGDVSPAYETITDMSVFGMGARGPIVIGTILNTPFSAPNKQCMYMSGQPEGTEIAGITPQQLLPILHNLEEWFEQQATPTVREFVDSIRETIGCIQLKK